jgi:uncharacterized membrane protein YfcA
MGWRCTSNQVDTAMTGPLLLGSSAQSRNEEMRRQAAVVLYVLALIAVVVGADVLFFQHLFWERLIVNVGIVLVFGAVYMRFLKRP